MSLRNAPLIKQLYRAADAIEEKCEELGLTPRDDFSTSGAYLMASGSELTKKTTGTTYFVVHNVSFENVKKLFAKATEKSELDLLEEQVFKMQEQARIQKRLAKAKAKLSLIEGETNGKDNLSAPKA